MPESFNKIPEVTLAFWIIKIAATTLGETGGDTVTMTLNWGYLAGTALFLAALVLLANHSEEISSLSILGDNHCLHHVRHDYGGFCRSLVRCRLHRRLVDFVVLFVGHSWPLVLVARLDFGRHRQHAKGGGVLLGCHHFFADPWK